MQKIRAKSRPVKIKASEGSKPKTFRGIAYTGGPMWIGGYDRPIIIDLATLRNKEPKIVANLDHEETKRVGHVTHVENDGKRLFVEGVLSAATPERQEVIRSAADGFDWEFSIEVDPQRTEPIEVGETVSVNGQTHKGPCYVARDGEFYGLAFVGQGACDETRVVIAKRIHAMSFEEWLSMKGFDIATLDDEQIAILRIAHEQTATSQGVEVDADFEEEEEENLVKASEDEDEEEEIKASRNFNVRAIKAGYREALQDLEIALLSNEDNVPSGRLMAEKAKQKLRKLKASAARSRMSRNRFEDAARRIVSDFRLGMIRASRPQAFSIHASNRDSMDSRVIQASLLVRAGRENLAFKKFGEQITEQARRSRLTSMMDICAMAIQSEGKIVPRDGKDAVIRAAFSTSSLPNILSNVANQTLVAAYEETTSSWDKFCTIKSSANFKPNQGIRPSAIKNLEPLAPDGQISHGKIKEEDKYEWQLGTFALMHGITRHDIMNDDLSFFDTLMPAHGVAAGRTLNDLIWRTIMAGQTANHWSVANGNLLGAGSALSVAALRQGVNLMKLQLDSLGNNVGIKPEVLAVPVQIEDTALSVLKSTELVGGNVAMPSGNPSHMLVPGYVAEPRLSNTKFTGNSQSAWYIFGGPSSEAVIVGFLDGQQTPTIETQEADFNKLGIQMRVVFDFACALGDHRASVKATGAAPAPAEG